MVDEPNSANQDLRGESTQGSADQLRLPHSRPSVGEFPAIPGYDILRLIAKSGQGEIFEAIQQATGGQVAIKVLKQSLYKSEEAKRNLAHEIRVLVQLRHPNIVSVYDAGETYDGRLYFIMEYISGSPLREYVRRQKLTLLPMLRLFATVCEAVRFFHEKGVVHRDLKPANILVDALGTPKILDFGLSKTLVAPHDMSESDIAGTLPYMSPEQTRQRSETIGLPSDVYSLGVILYELLVGHYPYPITGSLTEIVRRIAEATPASLRESWSPPQGIRPAKAQAAETCPIDRELEAIVLTALAKDPAARYGDAKELAADIRNYLSGRPIKPFADRLRYMGWVQVRRLANKHPVLAMLLTVLFLFTFVEVLCGSLIYAPIDPIFQIVMTQELSSKDAPLSHVALIGIEADTNHDELLERADKELLFGATAGPLIDSSQTIQRSVKRASYGRLMQKLAKSGCRVVVWDMEFQDIMPGQATAEETAIFAKGDNIFLEGIAALNRANAEVVVGRFAISPEMGTPIISQKIRKAVKCEGTVAAYFTDEKPWSVPLIAQRGERAPWNSLALCAVMAYWFPREEPHIQFDEFLRRVSIAGEFTTRYVVFSEAWETPAKEDIGQYTVGLIPEDRIGWFQFELPTEDIMDTVRTSYSLAFAESEAFLKSKFENKIVVIGNTGCKSPEECDRFAAPGGREGIWGCMGHAAAMDAVIRGAGLRFPNRVTEASASALASILGAGLAVCWPMRRRRRLAILAGCTVGLVWVSIIAFREANCLWNPGVAILALWVTSEACPFVRRMCMIQRDWQ